MTTSLARSRATSVALSLALMAGGVTALAGTASAAPVGGALLYGLTADNGLVTIRTDSGVTAAAKPITGLDAGDALVGIDVRPASGALYAVAKGAVAGDDNLYTILPATGAATKIGSPLTTRLSGTGFGVDVNPVADAVRVVSDTGQNLAVNITTGAVTVQTPLALGGLLPATPSVNGAAYTPPASGATTLFDLDVTRNRLYTQVPASGALTTVGSLTGTAPTGRAGFDIDSLSGTGYASLTVGGTTGLYTVALPTTEVLLDLPLPQATRIGAYSLGNVVDIAAAPSRIGFADQDFSVGEVDGTAVITVTRLGDASEPASAVYATSNGTATVGQDYTDSSGVVTFPANATTATITVPILDDTAPDGDETFAVTLSAPSAATLLGDPTTTVTIVNDDSGSDTSVVSVELGPQLVAENAGTVTVPVTRTNPGIRTVVSYTTADGDAQAGADYAAASGTVVFEPGEAQKNIVITLLNDTEVEGNQSFGVFLSSPSAGSVLGQAQAVVTTVSEDAKRPTVITHRATALVQAPNAGTIAGTLVDANGVGLGGRTVYIVYAPKENPSGLVVVARTLTTQANGLFSTLVSPTEHALYAAVYNGSTQELGAASRTTVMLVKFSNPTVTGQTTVRARARTLFRGAVQPGSSRAAVRLQFLSGGRWFFLAPTAVCAPNGSYALSLAFRNRGTFTVRVVAPGTPRNGGAVSKSFSLRVT